MSLPSATATGVASARVTVNVVGGGLQPPAQAAAAGYTRLVFQEEFDDYSGIDMNDNRTAGFKFYRFIPFGGGVLPRGGIVIANSVLTLSGGTNYNYAMGSTCGKGGNQWVGFDVTGGAYFEASIAFDPFVSAPGWPAFWSMADEHLWGGNNTGWIEADFMVSILRMTGNTSPVAIGGIRRTSPPPSFPLSADTIGSSSTFMGSCGFREIGGAITETTFP